MMLRKMRQEEFPAYRDYFIEDYSREIMLNYGRSSEDAITQAKQELSRSFPNGVEQTNQELQCIEVNRQGLTQVVGYLWYSIDRQERAAFICDFYVAEKYRGQSYGKQAMQTLEHSLERDGIHQIKLRVAFHNKRAFALYETLGFAVTGFNMAKNVSA